jgi:hypothetical protein
VVFGYTDTHYYPDRDVLAIGITLGFGPPRLARSDHRSQSEHADESEPWSVVIPAALVAQ